MKFIISLLATAALFMPLPAFAQSVFLNGVDISTVRDQTFKNATVSIDKDGNVRIDAPAYKVQVLDPGTPNSSEGAPSGTATPLSKPTAPEDGGPNPALTQKYYLVTQPSSGGRAQYDFVILVNGLPQKTIKAGSPQVIMEISAWLKKGENNIEIRAVKDLSQGRLSVAPTDEARILIGLGHEENKTVKIDSVKASVKANASLSTNVIKHFTLIAR